MNSREIYTLDIESFDDDLKFNPAGIGYRVTVYGHGEELGDGVAYPLSLAIQEALEQSGITERMSTHEHAPYGGVETYPYAKIGKCQCGVDMVSYAAEITAKHNWNEWEVTALDDPCLTCGGYNTPSCCEREE